MDNFGFWFFMMPAIGAGILFAAFMFVVYYYLFITPEASKHINNEHKDNSCDCDNSNV